MLHFYETAWPLWQYLLEDQSLVSNLENVRKGLKTPKSPPKIVRRRARQTKPKKANLDPLSHVALAKPVAKFNFVDPSPDPSPVKRKRRKISALATKSTSRKPSRKPAEEKPRATPRTAKMGTRVSPREKKSLNYTEAKSSTTVESIDLKGTTKKASREKLVARKTKTAKKTTKKVEEEPEETTKGTKKTTARKTKKQLSRKPATKSAAKSSSVSDDDTIEPVKPKKVKGPIKKKSEPTKKKTVQKSESY